MAHPERTPADDTSTPSTDRPAEPPTDAVGAEDVVPDEAGGPAAPMNRRERRAAARGGSAAKIAGPDATRLRPPPPAKRNYAARKGG